MQVTGTQESAGHLADNEMILKKQGNLAGCPAETDKTKSPVGNGLLSQRVAPQVPSALASLTSGFGMGPGVPPPLKSPTRLFYKIMEFCKSR
jgi:hypothetical protein